jgi:hypothetical protein
MKQEPIKIRLRIKAGFGYWDTTHYPYGGCFRRSNGTIEGDAEPVTHYSNGQVKEYRLRNGKESYVCIAEATEAIGGAP